MSNKLVCLFALLSILVLSCKSKPENKSVAAKIDYQRSLINFSIYNSEYENWMSFPVWFNDSLVAKYDIEAITREVFSQGVEDTSIYTNEFLDKRWHYVFNPDGTISSVDVSVIYDAKTISEIQFKYKGFDRKTGYAQVLVSEKELADYENLPYVIHNKNGNHNFWSSYTEWSNQHQVFILNNRDHWKSLVIDSMLHPKPVDYIFWGGLIRPERSYNVSNLVEESNVRNFTYNKQMLMEIERVEDPFVVKRSFQHNANGRLTDIVDSTFSMGGFVSSAVVHIDYQDHLPVMVTKSLVKKDQEKIIYREKLGYVLRSDANSKENAK